LKNKKKPKIKIFQIPKTITTVFWCPKRHCRVLEEIDQIQGLDSGSLPPFGVVFFFIF